MQQRQYLAPLFTAFLILIWNEGAPYDPPKVVQRGTIRSFNVHQDLLSNYNVKELAQFGLLVQFTNNLLKLSPLLKSEVN